jgi:hypothetical protein
VVKEYTLKKSVNYSETYSPVMEFSNFLIICQYARAMKLNMWRFDISTAFLHADLKEDMYVYGTALLVLEPIQSKYGS